MNTFFDIDGILIDSLDIKNHYITTEKIDIIHVPQDKMMSYVHNIVNDGDVESLIKNILK